MLLAQSRPCLVQCLGYLDSESIRQVCLLSKEYHSLIHNDPGMANRWTKALEIRPSSSDDKTKYWGYLDQFVDQLYHHRNELQMIQEIRIIDPHRFKITDWGKIKTMIQRFQLGGIISLHIISPSTLNRGNSIILDVLTQILPRRNLRVVDLSNCIFYFEACLASFLKDATKKRRVEEGRRGVGYRYITKIDRLNRSTSTKRKHKIKEHKGYHRSYFLINEYTKRSFYIVSFFLLVYNGIYTIGTLRRYLYHNYYFNFQTKPILLSRLIRSSVIL